MTNLFRITLLAVVFLTGCELVESDSKNARLSDLTVSGGTLSPAFSPGISRYTVTVDATAASTTVSASTEDGKARVSINGSDAVRRSATAEVALDVGTTSITVVVTAEKRSREQRYVVNVYRPPSEFSIGGDVSGLAGSLTLQNNGGDDLTVMADGPYSFATRLADGADYSVTVATQPAGQACTVANGSGAVDGANVADVDITCVPLTFSVGGLLTGLADSVTLQNNGGDDLVLTTDGAFTFATELNDGAAYAVTVSSQPTDQQCTVTNGSGTISGADVTDVAVECAGGGEFRVAGVVNGLVGTLTLQLNGSRDLLVVRNGQFAFLTPFADGASYDVAVLAQPDGQTCTISNGSGTFAAANAVDVAVDCSGAGVVTGSIFDWEWIEPLPQGNLVSDLESDGSLLVGVGTSGHVQTSTDGQNWTTRDSGTGEDLAAVANGNGTFVAVSNTGTVGTSADAVAWQMRSLGFYSFYDVTWNGSLFVAVGASAIDGTSVIATSPDGDAWSTQSLELGDFSQIQSIAWNGSLFAAVGFRIDGPDLQSLVHTSPDATTWTTATLGGPGPLAQVVASDGSGFVAITDGSIVFTSPDGTAWTQQANPFPAFGAQDLRWDGSRYIAAGDNGFHTSADGTAWAANIVNPSPSAFVTSVIRFDGQNIATVGAAVYTSPDDSTWTTSYVPGPSSLRKVVHEGGQYVAVGSEGTIRTSPDGSNWTTRQSLGPATVGLWGVTFGGGQYVAVGVGSAPQVFTSPDGITWTGQSASPDPTSLVNVAWGNNQYVAVGSGGTIMTSPDGTAWTAQTSGLEGDEQLYDVAWTGSVWAVSGSRFVPPSGYVTFIATSPDGVAWTKHVLPPFVTLQGLDWNGSLLVGTGAGAIGTSADGINWSILETTAFTSEVTWDGSEFIAAGFYPQILRSADGLTWTSSRSLSGYYTGVASDGTTTVVVRQDGILVSPPP